MFFEYSVANLTTRPSALPHLPTYVRLGCSSSALLKQKLVSGVMVTQTCFSFQVEGLQL